MAVEIGKVTRREIRSPRAAALAGIGYSILMITGMTLTAGITRVRLENITLDLVESWYRKASLVILMVPFAGIAFLWFTGVIRDRLGEHEDRFFATLFYGSGIIQVMLLFIWGAIFGAVMATRTMTAVGLIENDIYIFSFALMNEIIGNYALRMAGIYMTAIATLWTRTGIMARWFSLLTYILALGFLFAAERFREARFIFPIWVFVVSIYVLIQNFRRTREQKNSVEAAHEGAIEK